MTILTKYTLEQYNKAIELSAQGYGSQRISKLLGIKIRGAVEDWINKGRKPYYFSEKRILACNSISIVRKQRRLEKQVAYIASRMEENEMTEGTNVGRSEDHTVFVGSKPFMNLQ